MSGEVKPGVRLWLIVATLVLAIGGGVAGWYVAGGIIESRRSGGSGVADIGGPFTLVDQSGNEVTEAALLGKHSLIYFGYTFCPDVCPTSLQTMSMALDTLGEDAEAVQPIFITVDPERDDVEQMAAYAEHFHPSFLNLTGSVEQVSAAAKAYRIYYRKVEDDSASEYLMDHSSIYYLMGPDGKFVRHFNHNATPKEIAEGIEESL